MNTAERNAILDRFEAEKRELGEGLLISTVNLENGERNAFHLGPQGDYCPQLGPDYEAKTNAYPTTGTTQITIRKIDRNGGAAA
jgi:hypothetical protein